MKKLVRLIFVLFIFNAINGCSNHEHEIEPILLLATENDFGVYTGEILKAEGFNEFRIDSESDQKISLRYLQQFDIIILADRKIKPTTDTMLCEYVENGGNLIALRPGSGLDNLFGIKSMEDNPTLNGYIGIDTTTAIGTGLKNKTMQIHGYADKYLVNDSKTIANLYQDLDQETAFPAVVYNRFGRGQAILFTYNLPESIAYTRQGDPLKAGKETDSIPGIRAMDMFTDNWIDTSRNTINQADEQMRLLSHCIEFMASSTKPLPRLWYFPGKLRCLITLTNDGEYRGESDFEVQLEDVDAKGAKMSLYILEADKVSSNFVKKWTSRGFEISGHPDDIAEATNPQWNKMYDQLLTKRNEIQELYNLPMKTVVNHWFVWCGMDSVGKPEFAAQAELESEVGIEMDVNYAHYDNNANQRHFLGPMGMNQGNYTGSGLIMKFVNSKGKIVNIYQHLNNVYDQQYMENSDSIGFFNCFKGLVNRSLDEEVYSFISIKAHNDEYFFSKVPLMKMLNYANQKNIPIWTVSKLLDFIKMKDDSYFKDISWSDNELKFKIVSNLIFDEGLTFLLPENYNDLKIINVLVNGNANKFETRKIKGHLYAFINISPGNTYHILAKYARN